MCATTVNSKSCLYLGLDPSNFITDKSIIHYPVIKISPRPITCPEVQQMYENIQQYSHIIFTSKNAVRIFFTYYRQKNIPLELMKSKHIIAVGKWTKQALDSYGVHSIAAQEEQQEGIIALLLTLPLEEANILLPRSSLSRPLLTHFLVENGIRHHACNIYDTIEVKPNKTIDFSQIDEIVFTAPSTVASFFSLYQHLPKNVKLTSIGSITKEALDKWRFSIQELSI